MSGDTGKAAFGPWARGAGLALAVGLGLAWLGPFGTYDDFTPAERYGYWIVLTLLMWLQCAAAFQMLRLWEDLDRLPDWSRAILAALAGAVPTTFEVAYAEGLLRVGGVLTPRSLAETYGSVAVIALAFFTPLVLLERPRRGPARTAEADAPSRLPPDVVALCAEDHYLRVFTPRGSSLIHHRLSDAVRELGGAGAQVHRSWWVSRQAVRQVEREGERRVLVLDGGVRAPVSRTYLLAARQAGLIPERD